MFNAVIKKPKITLLFILLVTIVGAITYTQLPQREIPEVTFDISTVSTALPGGSPEQVERRITEPLESELLNLDGIDEISSVSTSGFSNIIIEISEGADRDQVLSRIRQTVTDVSTGFPSEARTPDVSEEVQLGALSSYHLLSDDRENLYELNGMVEEWEEEIQSIPGVQGTIVKGLPSEEILIDIDYDALLEEGLQVPDVISAIEDELNTSPLGVERIDDENVQLALPETQELSALENLAIGLNFSDEPVTLSEVGAVSLGRTDEEDLITYENTPAASFTVIPDDGVDIPGLHETVDERLAGLAQELPADVTLDKFYTQNTIVQDIFGDLALSFLFAIVAVVVITLLGLNLSSAAIVALAIPVSILIGLVPLPFLGVDLNQISIIGMIIALGILVDDAIVVGDNVQRKYQEGLDPVEGAIEGTKEVRTSIITSTLAIVFTFLPLVFITGANGDFIRALPSVLITTILASTIIALSLVPIYLIWRRRRKIRKADGNSSNTPENRDVKVGLLGKQIDKLADWYSGSVLRRVVKHPVKVAISGLVFCILCYGLIPFIPVVFFPSADRPEVTVEVRMPAGTPLDQTEDVLFDMAEMVLAEDDAIYETAVYAGSGLPPLFGEGMSNTSEETGEILLRTDRDIQSAEETISRWTGPLQDAYPDAVIELNTIEAGPPVGAPIAIKLQGPQMEELKTIRDDLMDFIGSLPETSTVVDDLGDDRPVILYEPDRELMEENGITLNQISEQIGLATEGIPLTDFDDGTSTYPMQLIVNGDAEELDLSDYVLPSQAGGGEGAPELIGLDELTEEVRTTQTPLIARENGDRTITVRVFPDDGAQQDLESEIESYVEDTVSDAGFDQDYTISIGGETEDRDDFFVELATLFLVVIFLIYIVMAIQFYSLVMPFLIMSTVFLAVTGAIIGLFITQTGLGFMAMMGIVSLAGIVVRNSIVLIEFIEQRRRAGMKLEDAVVNAGKVRLRPILLTAITAIAALLPVAFSGDVLFVPLSISIISGLLFSAVFTVILVPAFYMVLKRRSARKETEPKAE
ncbi:efflux RND transporter permease subunit [Alteribacter natronophilus]|uniref:efflux RND transporter permease subunit n=1 Tax=Alteribacter natronophilus TaxID=2583810 RepID=UPI00110D8453|nr:efflux RND transporter permease subunit [Alteribacter natronophilus]TMW71493.1 efflux RND transporter permease subunit [Alteribacter natronophilus]